MSFIAGGVWVTLASMAAQRFGGKIGGVIAGLPGTSVLAIFFITYTEGARHTCDSAPGVALEIRAETPPWIGSAMRSVSLWAARIATRLNDKAG